MLKLSEPNISEDIITAVADVLRSGQLVQGEENLLFEKELAAYLGCKEVILVSSGTAALHLALLALDIGPGDAVLVPDFTFPATASVVSMVGARVVIADVDRGTYVLSPDQIERTLDQWQGPERIRALMPVHEFGCSVDMDAVLKIAEKNDLYIVEDAACALGAVYGTRKLGTFGDLGCFSFHPRKTLTTGEGGAISTGSVQLAQKIRRLRNHGMEKRHDGMHFFEPGLNYRLTNFQAAMGRLQLKCLDEWIVVRKKLVEEYRCGLAKLASRNLIHLPVRTEGHSWQTFMVVLDKGFDRAVVIDALRQNGVESNLGAQSLSVLDLYGDQPFLQTVGPELYRCGLALPLFERMQRSDVKHVCSVLESVLLS
ncbi:DegT/DnrJ/EryC1/StrS aminotransferase family protein [Desulfobotulus sp. H1]|uniref:DegT/DnrJ/EryC1/StrS aminotransferase family protein n=1 Tax=Desulfobotulus pelophilus TaxID=2823377 RepID=A0ABT3ND85_9BACT|nr:DegT/DnrJ/EryC1/StrS aminotransferase family protein [Desulfobotulus pelophilus]MCW7755425.1 DegT/DnrJ/EryC1/StrS aminotransferase family protein [Desulfobotulus pelophilus]